MNHCQENERVANEPEDMDTQEGKKLIQYVTLINCVRLNFHDRLLTSDFGLTCF